MKWQSSNISWSYRVEFKKSLSTFFVSYLLRCIIWVLNIKVMHFKLLSVINHTSSCLVWTLKVRGNFRITRISCFRWNSRSSHLPGLVMIISVPIPWKVFHRSGSSRVILMLPWRYAGSGPAAMEDGGGPLKFGFKSGRRKRVITAEVRRQEGREESVEAKNPPGHSPLMDCMLQVLQHKACSNTEGPITIHEWEISSVVPPACSPASGGIKRRNPAAQGVRGSISRPVVDHSEVWSPADGGERDF